MDRTITFFLLMFIVRISAAQYPAKTDKIGREVWVPHHLQDDEEFRYPSPSCSTMENYSLMQLGPNKKAVAAR